MNINQIMNMFDWELSGIKKLDVEDHPPAFYPNQKYIIGLQFNISDREEFNVYFNNLTSEVYHIIYMNAEDEVAWWAKDAYIENIYQLFRNINVYVRYSPVEVLLDLINEKVGKEPDEFLPIDMDNDMLMMVDDEAAKLDITRNDYLTKVVLEFIEKGEK